MSTTAGFHFEGPGGPISGRALAQFFKHVSGDAVNVLLKRYEGTVLKTEDVEIKNRSRGAVLCVTGLTAVVGRYAVDEPVLECPVAPGVTDVFVMASASPEALDPDVPAGLQARMIRGTLTTDPGSEPAVLVAKCTWARAGGLADGPLEASPNRQWWPRVLQVADHPFSRDAALKLQRLLGDAPPATAFSLAAAGRGEEIGWPQLTHEVLALMWGRFRDRPDRIAELGQVAQRPATAEVVGDLIRMLQDELAHGLPDTLEIDKARFRLRELVHDTRPSQHFGASGSVVKLDCGVIQIDGWVVTAIDDATGNLYRVTARVDSVDHDAIRIAGRGAEALVPLKAGQKMDLSIRGDATTPLSVRVGLYVPG